jgi:hypothetical protein
VFAPTDHQLPISEHNSFLPSIDTFTLDSCKLEPSKDLLSPKSPNQRGDTQDETTGASSDHRVPPRSQELQSLIQSAWDDVDSTLSQRNQSMLSPHAPAFWPVPAPTVLGVSLADGEGFGGAEAMDDAMEESEEAPRRNSALARVPTHEELTWLDAQCDAMEEVAGIQAEAEAEESWVGRMMREHPSLTRDEAHRLWNAGADSP